MGAAKKIQGSSKFKIEITMGPHKGKGLSFDQFPVSIGRGGENNIVLSEDPKVSRHHAEIRQRENLDFMIVNLSSKNFILVNGQDVQSELLSNDSVIQIGDSQMQFRLVQSVKSAESPKSPKDSTATERVITPKPVAVMSPKTSNGISELPVAAPANLNFDSLMVQNQKTPISHGFEAPHPSAVRPQMNYSTVRSTEKSKSTFYVILGFLILAVWFVLSPNKKKAKDSNQLRTNSIVMKDVSDAEKRTQVMLRAKIEKNDTVQYRRAQENLVKAFRDFRQGQYARAKESFQVVVNLDPDNELAKRYYHLSKVKFDELVKFNILQGNRYREKKNWRMCQSNFSNVMAMLQNKKDDPSYKEAKQMFEECTLNIEGRY